jgi:hypothetical protein
MPTTSAAGRRSESGVKPTTSAKTIEAESKWSAIAWVAAFSRSAIELGKMFTRSASDFSCSARSALSASLRCLAKEARSKNATDAEPITFNASIVLVNQAGRSASENSASPARPVSRKTTMNAPNQRTAWRTSRKTSAPSGARTPHNPTPPEGRNPPTSICPTVVVRRMSSNCVTRKGWNRRVSAKITNEATETAK